MKCPECGFECLPDDVECLACGIDIVSAAENKEKERVRGLEAAERKAKYDMEFKKELGLIPDDDKQDHAIAQKGTTLEETFKKVPICPKCGMERSPEEAECLRCGLIFKKFEDQQNGVLPEQKTLPISPAEAPMVNSPTQFHSDGIPFNPDIEASSIPQIKEADDLVRPEDKTDEIDLADLKMLVDSQTESAPVMIPPDASDEPILKMESSIPPMVTESSSPSSGVELSSVPPVDSAHPTETPIPVDQSTINAQSQQSETVNESIPQAVDTKHTEIPGANDKTEIIRPKTHHSKVRMISGGISGFEVFRKKSRIVFEKSSIFLSSALSKGQAKLIQLFGSKEKSVKILSVMSLLIIFSLATPFGISYYKTAKIERLKREHAQKLENIRIDYLNNKDAISKKISLIISNKLFDSAEKEIALYDIPSLQDQLVPLKNYLKEIRLYEKAKAIPALEFEQNYNAFLDLLKLNPESQLYETKKDFYRQKLANSEYGLAKSYLSSKNKSLPELNKAMASIDKAIELYPDSKNYILLKKKLLTENLLYYEGNENIVMAVQDDGMGKKLYSNQRKLTVWLKNISQETIYINVQFFILIGKDNKRYDYNDIGRRFKTKLMPGEQTRGELYFRTRTRPAKVVYNHLISGQISRVFP